MPRVKVTAKKGEKGWRGLRRGRKKKQKEITAYTTSEPRERRTLNKEPDARSPAKRQRRLQNEDMRREREGGDDESASTAVTSSSDSTTRPKRRQPSQSAGGGRVPSRSGAGKPTPGEESSENDFSGRSRSGESDHSDTEGRTTTARAAGRLGTKAIGPPAKRQRRLQSEDVQHQRRNDKSVSEEHSPRKYARGGTRTSHRSAGRQPSQSEGGGRVPSQSGARKPTTGEESENDFSGRSESGESDHSDREGGTITAGRKRARTRAASNSQGTSRTWSSRLRARKAVSDTTESDFSDREREQRLPAARQKQRHSGKGRSGSSQSGRQSSGSEVYDFSESADEGQSLRRGTRPKRVSFTQDVHGRGSSSGSLSKSPGATRGGGGGGSLSESPGATRGGGGGGSLSESPGATRVSRLEGGGGGGSSQESESEGGGESGGRQRKRKKASVREVRVSGSSVAKWQPMSQEARKVFQDVMLAGLGQCLEGMTGNRRRQVEQELQQLITRVNQKLETTKAPKITGRTQSSYSGMKQRVAELKEKCLSLVQRNQELEQKSEERKRSIEERQQKAEQLAGAVSSSAAPPTVNVEDYPEPPEDSDSDGEAFLGYVVELVGRSRAASSHGRERMAAGGLL